MAPADTRNITAWLASPTLKFGTLDAIEWELAEAEIGCASKKQLGAALRQAGWKRHNNGFERIWIAPGLEPWDVGVGRPPNAKMRVALAVRKVFNEIPEGGHINVAELHAKMIAALGEGAKHMLDLINTSANRQKGWMLDRGLTPPAWRRTQQAAPLVK